MTTNRPLPSKMVERALAAWANDWQNGPPEQDDKSAMAAALSAAGVGELMDALRPFVAFCVAYDGKQRGLAKVDDDPIYTFNGVPITLGMLRRAREALAAAENGGGE